MNEPDYEGGGEEEVVEEDEVNANKSAEPTPVQSRERSPETEHNADSLDPALAEWFRGGNASSTSTTVAAEKNESGTETESDHDSDNADVANAEENVDDDDWIKVKRGQDANESEDVQDVKMGETNEAMAYDEELIFKHLQVVSPLLLSCTDHILDRCFYLDSPENARQNGMEVKSKREEDITARYVCPSPLEMGFSPEQIGSQSWRKSSQQMVAGL